MALKELLLVNSFVVLEQGNFPLRNLIDFESSCPLSFDIHESFCLDTTPIIYRYIYLHVHVHNISFITLRVKKSCFVEEKLSLHVSVMELFAVIDEMLNFAVFELSIFSG